MTSSMKSVLSAGSVSPSPKPSIFSAKPVEAPVAAAPRPIEVKPQPQPQSQPQLQPQATTFDPNRASVLPKRIKSLEPEPQRFRPASPAPQPAGTAAEEEELDIPAFIRKKML